MKKWVDMFYSPANVYEYICILYIFFHILLFSISVYFAYMWNKKVVETTVWKYKRKNLTILLNIKIIELSIWFAFVGLHASVCAEPRAKISATSTNDGDYFGQWKKKSATTYKWSMVKMWNYFFLHVFTEPIHTHKNHQIKFLLRRRRFFSFRF